MDRMLRRSMLQVAAEGRINGNAQGTVRSTSCVDLQHFVPFRFVLEHDLAEETDGWHAVVEKLVVEFLEREFVALLRFVIVAQFENLQFPERVIEIAGIERA